MNKIIIAIFLLVATIAAQSQPGCSSVAPLTPTTDPLASGCKYCSKCIPLGGTCNQTEISAFTQYCSAGTCVSSVCAIATTTTTVTTTTVTTTMTYPTVTYANEGDACSGAASYNNFVGTCAGSVGSSTGVATLPASPLTCIASVCVRRYSVALAGVCQTTADCVPGLQCVNSKCENPATIGTACVNDTQCVTNVTGSTAKCFCTALNGPNGQCGLTSADSLEYITNALKTTCASQISAFAALANPITAATAIDAQVAYCAITACNFNSYAAVDASWQAYNHFGLSLASTTCQYSTLTCPTKTTTTKAAVSTTTSDASTVSAAFFLVAVILSLLF
jgi:hypothetical protein